jgi:protein TonB
MRQSSPCSCQNFAGFASLSNWHLGKEDPNAREEPPMEHPTHDILMVSNRRGLTKQRMLGYALSGLVNLGLIAVLIEGLAVHYLRHETEELKAQVIQQAQPEKAVDIPKPTLIVPKDVVAPPEIVVQQPQQTIQTRTAVASSAPASRANGINSTHTTPPYPPNARRNGQEGAVVLHIMISAQGDVTSATVSRTSGVPELDQTAVNWVIGHWKYRPATDNGVAVVSASDARVVFSLKNASL